MPIYEYGCSACGKTIDVLQKMSDPAPAACTACGAGGTLTKQVSRSSFHLKGGGWYSDLYGSTKKDGGGASSSTPSTSTAAPSTSTPPASTAPAASSTASSSGSASSGGSSSSAGGDKS